MWYGKIKSIQIKYSGEWNGQSKLQNEWMNLMTITDCIFTDIKKSEYKNSMMHGGLYS